MARPPNFNRQDALEKAMSLFWDKGYEGTSTEDLVKAMGIGRQSMYGAFGDKHTIYMEALKLYQQGGGKNLQQTLCREGSPLEAIQDVLDSVASQSRPQRKRGCLLVNATAELANIDKEIGELVQDNFARCAAAFEQAVYRAQAKGELPSTLQSSEAGDFLMSTYQGLRISAKAGASPERLRQISAMAIKALGNS